MKKVRWLTLSLNLLLFLIATLFALSLLLPLARGESPIELGLDLSGGVIVTYRPDPSSRLEDYRDMSESELLALAKETLESRLSRSFSTFPDVVVRGDGRIVAGIPALDDPREALERIGKTYHLTMRLLLDDRARASGDEEVFSYRGRQLLLAPPAFSGDMLDERSIRVETGASGSFDADRSAKVTFAFRPPHDAAFETLTGEHVGERLAILLDDRVEWLGTIESAIPGSGVLAGGYDLEQAREVATMLRAGTLPIALEVESMDLVGPSLGQEIQELGWRALLLALVLLGGLVAVAYRHRRRLLIAGLLSLGCLLLTIAGLAAVFGLTLDLAGIAGIVLSIGMGMDAFILVFESLDARLAGMSAQGLAAHYRRIARNAYSFAGVGRILFHANVTTLLAIVLLLGADRLRSFAIFIFVGLLASVLTILATRQILQLSSIPRPGRRRDLLAWLRRSRPRLFRLRHGYFVVLATLLLVTAALTATGIPGAPSLTLGNDFRPGTQILVTSPDRAALETAVAELETRYAGLEPQRQRLGEEGSGRHLLTLGTVLASESASLSGDALDAAEVARVLTAHAVEVESIQSIDGRVSSRRIAGSLTVFLGSLVLLALYFGLLQGPVDRLFAPDRGALEPTRARTRLRVFAGILLALVADVGVALATLAWLGIPIDLAVVAGFLTVVGYSVNDSVVLWSQVESRKGELRGGKKPRSALSLVTSCVDRILSRAFLTSLSTLMPALTILAVGLAPLYGFAWVMIAGTVAGTLSSIFIVGAFAVRALEQEMRGARYPLREPAPETLAGALAE